MNGFTWYQSRQYREQAAIQAQLDSIATVERMAAMAADSLWRAQGLADGNTTSVKVNTLPAYKDSLLMEARLASEEILSLSNDKIEIDFTTKGAQPYSVRLKDYKAYKDSNALELIKPEMSSYAISLYAGENIKIGRAHV